MIYGLYDFYAPLIVLLAIYAIQLLQSNSIKYKAGNYAFIICIFLLIGIRSLEVGNDTLRYFDEFQNSVDDLNWGGRGSEVGFTYILALFNWAGLSFQVFNLIYSLIISYALIKIFKINGFQFHFVVIGLFFTGYFFMGMSGMRQMLAVSLFLLSCYMPKSIVEIPLKIILFVLAVFIHNTSLIGLPILFMTVLQASELSIKVKRLFLLVLGTLIIMASELIEIDQIISSTKYNFYLDSGELRPLSIANVSFWVCVSLFSVFAAISNYKYKKVKNFRKLKSHQMIVMQDNQFPASIYIYSGLVTAAAFYVGLEIPLMDRFLYYFQPFIFGAIGLYLNNINSIMVKRLAFLVLFCVGVAFMTLLLINDPFGLLG